MRLDISSTFNSRLPLANLSDDDLICPCVSGTITSDGNCLVLALLHQRSLASEGVVSLQVVCPCGFSKVVLGVHIMVLNYLRNVYAEICVLNGADLVCSSMYV